MTLLACPFCGVTMTNIQYGDDDLADFVVWFTHPKADCWMSEYEYDCESDDPTRLMRHWNTRAPQEGK